MRELATLLVSDGLPGHFRLSEGICAAITRRRPLAITRVEVRRPSWLPARALSAMTNAGGKIARPALAFLGVPAPPLPECDLVVSAGGDTLAANIALARHYGCPNIFYGSLRRYRPADFGLVLTSYEASTNHPNQVLALKPSAFDPASLRKPNREPRTIGLLIGGDSGTVRYAPGDWDALVSLLAEDSDTASWIVANSRRTPAAVSDRIAALAQSNARIRFVDVRHAGNSGLTELLAASDAVAVTVDSSSMISEAIWARRPVAVLTPQRHALPDLEQHYRDYLAAQGWTVAIPLAGASPRLLREKLATVIPLTGNPLESLAGLIEQRLPELFA